MAPSPSQPDYTDDLRLAHVLADDADSLTTARFRALDLHVMSKPDLTPVTDEMSRDGYRANEADRCFFCKAELLDVLLPMAVEHGLAHVTTGTNADDAVAGFRPGIRAAAERGAVTPLLDAGLTKEEVRAISREWGLVTWDKPAAACLSSRIAYGIEVSPYRLARVERAEADLRAALAQAGLAVANLRVRDLGDAARVEVDAELVGEVSRRPELLAAVTGFATVDLDPRVFKAGDTAVYLFGATNDAALPLRAGYFMHWRIIGWLRESTNARWYDLGGTDGQQVVVWLPADEATDDAVRRATMGEPALRVVGGSQ